MNTPEPIFVIGYLLFVAAFVIGCRICYLLLCAGSGEVTSDERSTLRGGGTQRQDIQAGGEYTSGTVHFPGSGSVVVIRIRIPQFLSSQCQQVQQKKKFFKKWNEF